MGAPSIFDVLLLPILLACVTFSASRADRGRGGTIVTVFLGATLLMSPILEVSLGAFGLTSILRLRAISWNTPRRFETAAVESDLRSWLRFGQPTLRSDNRTWAWPPVVKTPRRKLRMCARPCSTNLFGAGSAPCGRGGKRCRCECPPSLRRSRKFASPAETRAALSLLGRSLGDAALCKLPPRAPARELQRLVAKVQAANLTAPGASVRRLQRELQTLVARRRRKRSTLRVWSPTPIGALVRQALLGWEDRQPLGPGELLHELVAAALQPHTAPPGSHPWQPPPPPRCTCREKRGRPVCRCARGERPIRCAYEWRELPHTQRLEPFSFRGLLRRTWLSEIHPTADERVIRCHSGGSPNMTAPPPPPDPAWRARPSTRSVLSADAPAAASGLARASLLGVAAGHHRLPPPSPPSASPSSSCGAPPTSPSFAVAPGGDDPPPRPLRPRPRRRPAARRHGRRHSLRADGQMSAAMTNVLTAGSLVGVVAGVGAREPPIRLHRAVAAGVVAGLASRAVGKGSLPRVSAVLLALVAALEPLPGATAVAALAAHRRWRRYGGREAWARWLAEDGFSPALVGALIAVCGTAALLLTVCYNGLRGIQEHLEVLDAAGGWAGCSGRDFE